MDNGFDVFKQHALAGLNRHTRQLVKVSQRQYAKARKSTKASGTSIPPEGKIKQRLCDKCGCVVETDAESEVDTESEADAELPVHANLEKIPGHACDTSNEGEIARIIKESGLSILKGKSNYKAWAADTEKLLSRKKIAYILTPHILLDSMVKQYDDWVGRRIIYAHISTARADRLRRRTIDTKFAWHVWSELRADVLHCPCNDLKEVALNDYEELSKYQESAEDGCSSCKLILDAVEAFAPGWISPSNFSKKGKLISAKVSSYLIQVKLKGGHIWGRHFEFFVQPGLSKCLSTSEKTHPPLLESSRPVYLEIASTWLKNCIEGHPACAAQDPNFMPSRLIYVSQDNSEPFLVEGEVKAAPYVALSYCWGNVENTLVTTRENIIEHLKRIPFALLPQTLKDAVTVCRVLCVRYLWIDALCIIQNDIDNQDWYSESGMMRHIYSNALFVIAADISRNCKEGFLRKDYDKPGWRTFPRINREEESETVFFRTTVNSQHLDSDALLTSALSKRGWALQESILPNRILHFAREISWECNTHCQCQCRRSDYSLVKVQCCGILKARTQPSNYVYDEDHDKSREIMHFLSSRTVESVYWAWQTIVEYYTKRQLTNHADKLSALSGLAQLAIDSHGFDATAYLAGLWRNTLVKGLLWHVRGPPTPQRYTTYRAPSWSWASIDGSVKYFTEHYQFRFEDEVIILEAKCEASSSDPTGRVKAGHIILSGRLQPVKITITSGRKSRYTGYNGQAGHTHIDQLVHVKAYNGKTTHEVLMDESMQYGEVDCGYYCLQVGTTLDSRTGGARGWWLVLKKQSLPLTDVPCSTTSPIPTFERVGIGYEYFPISSLGCDLFLSKAQNMEPVTLRLI